MVDNCVSNEPAASAWLFGEGDARIANRRVDSFFDDVLSHIGDWDLDEGMVISIYGAGGEGKSTFITDLRKICEDRLPDDVWKTVYLDFYEDSSSTLGGLRQVFEAFASAGVFCSRFAIAYQSYQHPGNMSLAAEGYLNECQRLVDDSSFIGEASGPISSFLGITSIACDLLSSSLPVPSLRDAVDLYMGHREQVEQERARREAEDLWRSYADHDKQGLLKLMPSLMRQDVEEALARRENGSARVGTLVIVDSFEHLFEGVSGELSTVGELVRDLSHTPATLWVVAGRARLSGDGWDNVVHYPIELVDLDRHGTARVLAEHGITDESLVTKIHRFSGGLPLFVVLCVEALRDVPIEKWEPSFDRLIGSHETREDLLRHFVNDLDDDMELAVYAMSYLHEWDEPLLARALTGDGLMDEDMADLVTEDASSLSFVSSRGDKHQIHERIAEMLRSLMPESRQMQVSLRKLFKNLRSLLEDAYEESGRHIEDARRLRLILSRALFEMARHGNDLCGRIDASALFDIRVGYVDELKWAGLTDDALAATDEILPLYEGNLERELTLRLMRAAQLTQLWIKTGEISKHLEALETERDVLARIEEDGADRHHALYMRARNSVGVSLQRIAKTLPEVEEAIAYLRPNYDEASATPSETLRGEDASYLNNYGVSCLRAAEYCESGVRRESFLEDAVAAFEKAAAARKMLFGDSDANTLRCLTNKGIALARLGRYDEAGACFDLADCRFREAGYGAGQPDWLYNRFHQAILMEREADAALCEGNLDGALAMLLEAANAHERVYHDRRRYHAGAQAVEKSRERVERCRCRVDEVRMMIEGGNSAK